MIPFTLDIFRSKHFSATNTNKDALSSSTTIINDEATSSGTLQYMASSTETLQQITGALQIVELSLTSPNITHSASTNTPPG